MDAIEKRARELYAQAARANGMEFTADRVGDMVESGAAGSQRAVLDAIVAALTPPEGYVSERSVLVAATRIRKLASAATPMARSAYIKAAEMVEMAVIAARAEAPDSAEVTVVSKAEADELSRRRVARMEGAE